MVARILTAFMVLLSAAPALSQQIPIPDEAAQNAALALVNEVYKSDYEAAKTDEQKIALARKMLQQGAAMKNDPAGHYVLFRMAHDLAGKAGDVPLAFQAIDEMQKVYEVDALKMKAAVIADAAKVLRDAKEQHRIISPISALIDEAIARDDYELAKTLCETAIASARKTKDSAAIKQLARRNEEVEGIAAAYAESLAAREFLAKKPTDPSANLTVGKFFCFVKGDWVTGIPMLALGNDNKLKPLAIQELDSPAEPLALGDAWWSLSESQDEAVGQRIRQHAAHWYKKALPALSGLNKAKIEKRVSDVAASEFVVVAKEVIRYKGFDATRVPAIRPRPLLVDAAFLGDWQLRGDELVQAKVGKSFLSFGDAHWTDYDVSVEMWTLRGGAGTQGGSLAFRTKSLDESYLFTIGNSGGKVIDLKTFVKGQSPSGPSYRSHRAALRFEHWYTMRVEVRGTAIRCFVDGVEVFQLTDNSLPQGLIALCTWNSSVKWKNLTVKAPDGTLLWDGFPDVSKL